MVGWHHRLDGQEFEQALDGQEFEQALDGQEFEQALGDGEGQGSLACCSPWGHKESGMIKQPTTATTFELGNHTPRKL